MVMKKNGYTLVELVIVIAITIVLLVSATSLFFTTFVGGGKTASAEAVKQAGEYALSQMSYLIYNAHKLTPNLDSITCAENMSSIGIQNQDLQTTVLQKVTTGSISRIASNSGIYLTPANMNVTAGPNFSCTRASDGSSAVISVTFTLQKGVVGTDNTRDIISIPFQTQMTMRNY
jgi:type II secretory pathway pseudopilin PulG